MNSNTTYSLWIFGKETVFLKCCCCVTEKEKNTMSIQGISGHSDVFTLMNRYAHPQEDKVIELTNEIAEVLTHNATE